jgi:sporulation protein YlmC with PRC-barrel domain
VNAAELIGRPVLDLTTATTVGRVDDIVVDPATRRALGLRLAKSSAGDWLAWEQISAIGTDAVTIAGADCVQVYAEDPSRRTLRANGALGGRVLTDQGRDVGPLDDVDIDDDGTLSALVIATDRVGADDLLGIGSYATVVRDPAGA